MSKFTVRESDVIKRSGIRREVIIGHRNGLKKGEDWDKVGIAIMYTEEAAGMVLGLVGIPVEVNASAAVVESSVDSLSVLKVGVVAKRFRPNTRVMECEVDGVVRVVVKVRNNEMFEDGQRVPIRWCSGAVWELGCDQPRRRGQLNWKDAEKG